jgi:hypothetical protein
MLLTASLLHLKNRSDAEYEYLHPAAALQTSTAIAHTVILWFVSLTHYLLLKDHIASNHSGATALYNWLLYQFHFKIAFLHGDLAIKSLCNLKQSLRAWFGIFSTVL